MWSLGDFVLLEKKWGTAQGPLITDGRNSDEMGFSKISLGNDQM